MVCSDLTGIITLFFRLSVHKYCIDYNEYVSDVAA